MRYFGKYLAIPAFCGALAFLAPAAAKEPAAKSKTAAKTPAAKPVAAQPAPAMSTPGYDTSRIIHDTPGHELGQDLGRQMAPGAPLRDKLIAPAAKSVAEAKLIDRLFSQAVVAAVNTVVEALPPDQAEALLDEPVAIARELLQEKYSDAAFTAAVNLHRDDTLLPLNEFIEASGALDLDTRQRLVTPLLQDSFELSADARIRKAVSNIHEISRAELDFAPKTSPDVALLFMGIGKTVTDITPEQYQKSLDLLDGLYKGGLVTHFTKYAQANYPFATRQNPIIRLAKPFECVFDPAGRRGFYRSARTTGIIIQNYPALDDFTALSLENLDRFTEPAGLQMIHNIFRYPRLPQLIEGFHIAVDMGKFDKVIENTARMVAGETAEAPGAESPEAAAGVKGGLSSKFQQYMKEGNRSRLILFLTGQTLALLGDLGDVRLKSDPKRTMLNESIDFVTYLLVGDSSRGIPPVVDPLLETLYDILGDTERGQRFMRILAEASKIILNPPNGLDVKDLDNQLSDILKCDPEVEFAAVLRDQLDDDPKNGDVRPAVPVLKLIAKTDPRLASLSLNRYGELVRKRYEEQFIVFLKRIYEAESPDWYPITSLSEEVFQPRRGGKAIFERGGQIVALSLPEARDNHAVLQRLTSEQHKPDLLAAYALFQRVLEDRPDPKAKTPGEKLSALERLSPGAVKLARAENPLTRSPALDDVVIALDAVHHAGLDATAMDLLVLLSDQGYFDRKRDPNIFGAAESILSQIEKTRTAQRVLLEPGVVKSPAAAKAGKP